jgi:hypothetical protein
MLGCVLQETKRPFGKLPIGGHEPISIPEPPVSAATDGVSTALRDLMPVSDDPKPTPEPDSIPNPPAGAVTEPEIEESIRDERDVSTAV